ncbi:MAG: nucleotide exchange factor GrpE [Deltaproteobacteria bacterium]|nr:nucleotide exchange factor GrpE [Deltaproteobacteria bacterium]
MARRTRPSTPPVFVSEVDSAKEPPPIQDPLGEEVDLPAGPTIEIDPELLEAVLASAERIGSRTADPAGPPEAFPSARESVVAPHAPAGASIDQPPDEASVVALPEDLVEVLEEDTGLAQARSTRVAAESRVALLEGAVREGELEKVRLERALQILRARLEARESDLNAAQRRFGREMESTRQQAADHVLREVMPVLDLLQVAVCHAEADASTILDGVRMVLNQFQRILERMGVSQIQADPGTVFDPSVHEAILQVPHDTLPPGTIAEEIRSGWRVADRLLLPARVAVAGPAGPCAAPEPQDDGPGADPGSPAPDSAGER